MTIAAVVLAAGAGSRFEGDSHKLLAPFRHKPLVEWAVASAVQAGLDEVYVICGAVPLQGVVDDSVTFVENHSWSEGQSTSLRAAVHVATEHEHEAIVVGLGDMPLVPASAWRAVADAPGQLVTATFRGKRCPPVKIDQELWGLLPISGDEGARAIMRLRPDLVDEVACEGNAIDIDTRGDLSRWS